MKKINITAKNHVFLIGIGGISMSGLANLLVNMGIKVSGSDQCLSEITNNLQKLGVKIYEEHSQTNIEPDVDLVIFTGAIPSDNEELQYCKQNNIQTIERSEFLGYLCDFFKKVISVSGTHGKTTTTAMIGEILIKAGLNPTVHVGGEVVGGTGNFKIGGNEIFVTEACEYKKSLTYLNNNLAVITNIEPDHMDCYENYDELVKTFQIFSDNTKEVLFINKDVKEKIKHNNIIVLGENFTFKNIKEKLGCYSFDVYKGESYYNRFELNVIGKYQIYNAMYAIMVCDYLGVNSEIIKQALFEFKGVKRRNELIGNFNGLPVYADYAHHPTEILNSIMAFKKIYKKVLVVFQPHTYSRTKTLKKEFTNCFKNAKRLILYKTYPAREKYIKGGDVSDMYNYINYCKHTKALCINLNELKQNLEKFYKKCNVILFLGAGDLYNDIKKLIN